MIRTCTATDPHLLDDALTARPCACGLTFDDTQRSTVYPHVFLMTDTDRARLAAWLDTVSVDDILATDPVELAVRVGAAVRGS